MKIKIIYFAYLLPNEWEEIVIEQLDSLYNIDLYNLASEIYMSVISDDIELVKLIELINNKYNKIKLVNVYNENLYEYPGIKTLFEVAHNKFNNNDNNKFNNNDNNNNDNKFNNNDYNDNNDNNDNEDTILLYFHSKGMVSKAHNERKLFFKYVIENYNHYLNQFKINNKLDVASLILHEYGYAFYNFFWVSSSYLRKKHKEPLITNDRYYYEKWVGNEETKEETVITYSPIMKDNKIKEYQQINGNNRAAEIYYDLESNFFNTNKSLYNAYYESFTNNNAYYESFTNNNSLILILIFILIIMVYYYKLNDNKLIFIIIIIIIIFILNNNNNNNNNIDYFKNTDNKYVCMYAYYEKNNEYKENLIYFLNHGLLDHIDYYIIINGNCTVDIPKQDNIKIIKRENKGFDFGAWSHCINNYIKKQYDYYIFLNTSVRGPYLTEEDKINNITWLDKFLLLFNKDDIKMVGTTILVLKMCNNDSINYITTLYNNTFKYNEPYTHIQSMFFILNNEGFNYLLNKNFFNENLINSYTNINDIIINYEIKMTQLILLNNWNINSIVPKFQNIDYRKQKEIILHETLFTNEELIFLKNISWYSFLI